MNKEFLPAIPDDAVRMYKGVDVRMRPSMFKTEVRKAVALSGTYLIDALRHACRMTRTPASILRTCIVHVNGQRIERKEWDTLYVREHDFITVTVPVMGGGGGDGKNPLATILSLVVVVVAAIAVAWLPGTALFASVFGAGAKIAGAVAGAMITMGGMLLVNALCPASTPKLSNNSGESESSSKIWSIDGTQNKADPYGCVPTVLGKIRVAPRYASASYSVIIGNDQYVRYLYVVSTGDCVVSEPRIGDTALTNFQEYNWIVRRSWTGETLKWFGKAKTEESLAIEMKQSVGWQTRTTALNTVHIMCVLIFEGLVYIDDQGNKSSVTVDVDVRYRKVGTSNWIYRYGTKTFNKTTATVNVFGAMGEGYLGYDFNTGELAMNRGDPICYTSRNVSILYGKDKLSKKEQEAPAFAITGYSGRFSGTVTVGTGFFKAEVTITGTLTIPAIRYTDQTLNQLRKCVEWDVPEGQYEVSLRRITKDPDTNSTKTTTRSTFTWTLLQSSRNKPSVVGDSKHPLTLIELELKATEQLSGNVDEFNVLAVSTAPCWDSDEDDWVVKQTSNPAALALRVATGEDIAKPCDLDELDLDSFKEFYLWCEKYGWKYNSWITSKTNAGEVFHNICSAGRGSYALLNGHGVIWDDPDSKVVDMLTQRNSWNFSSQKSLVTEPIHGLRMRFINEDKDYQEDERVVYLDGYNASNATNIIEWEQDGVTNSNLIWKHGRLRLAEMRLRPEVYTVSCEAESIALRRGDCIRVVHDVTLWGVTSGMITHVTTNEESKITGIELDEFCPMDAGTAYGVRITNSSSTDAYYSVASVAQTESRKLTFSVALPATTNIAIGDLVSFGKTESVGALCKVLSVTPSEGFSATITLCDAAPDIYKALSGNIPSWESQITTPTRYQAGRPVAPVVLGFISDDTVLLINPDGTIQAQMEVTFQIPDQPMGVTAYSLSVYVRESNSGDNWQSYTSLVNGQDTVTVLIPNVQQGKTYEVRGRLSTGTGLLSDYSATTAHKVVGKTSIPPEVTGLVAVNKDPDGVVLTWDELDDVYLGLKLFSRFIVSGSLSGETVQNTITLQPYKQTGTLTFNVIGVDITGAKSVNPATASVEISVPKTPAISSAKLLAPGVVVAWADAKSTWSIERYALTMLGRTQQILKSTTCVLPATTPWNKDTAVTIAAMDIFSNWGATSSPYTVSYYPPKTPKITVGFNKLNGCVTVDWQDCKNDIADAPEIAHYLITGTLANQNNVSKTVTVKGTHFESVVPLTAYEYGTQTIDGVEVNVGTITIGVTAVDQYGITNKDNADYKDNSVQFSIYPPYNPTNMSFNTSTEGDNIVLSWKDCTNTFAISYYLVTDVYTKRTYKVDTNYVVLPARKEGTYQVSVQAVDVVGFESAAMTYNMVISGVGGMAVKGKIDGSDILLEWSVPDASFPLDYYIVKGDNDIIPDEDNISFEDGTTLGTAKANYFRMPAGQAGTYVFYVWAVDIAGNVSTDYASYCTVTVEAPAAPSVSVAREDQGLRLTWAAQAKDNSLPVKAWDVIRQYEDATGTKEEDYGRLDVTSTALPAVLVGLHTFMVRPVDSGGNIGPWGSVELKVSPPGQVTFSEPTVIDNNVQLYWTAPNYIFFPIKEYIFSEVDEDGYSMEIGRVDALFASETETTAGMYTYSITPVDTGGNLGTTNTITCRVSQPAGFVFYDKKSSLFNGERTNFVLDGLGHMLGPVPDGEIWTENAQRVIEQGGLSATIDTLTHQQKVDADFKTWLEPVMSVATYVETTDHGSLVPSSNIDVTIDYKRLQGTPNMTCKVEVSQDGEEWEVVSDNAFSVYSSQFRYSRITLTVTNGYVSINSILIDLKIKQISEYGRVSCLATDNGEGWISEQETPMLTGTWIPFNKDFVDVQSLPKPNVLNNEKYTAYTVFEDVINPKGFRVFIKDKDGNRVSATVDWIAMGV